MVYDRVNKIGGAERILLALHELWPQAPLFTAVYNSKTAPWAKRFQVKTSFLQKIPLAKTHHQWLALLTPLAFQKLDFSGFDLVISVTSAEAKVIIVSPKTLHICYCLTPTRYLWSGKAIYEGQALKGFGLRFFGPALRIWDFNSAQKPNLMLAISNTVKKRIKKYYRREAEVIYPPLDTKLFEKTKQRKLKKDKSFYLLVSRLESYKKVDLAIKAFNQTGEKLVIIGEGEEKQTLKKMAKSNIFFTGQLTDKELVSYYQSCRALIFPGEEDFGLTALEAQSSGRPVIAYGQGGVTETVIAGKTGIFFKKPTPRSLIKALRKFKKHKWSPKICQAQAQKFTKSIFKKKFRQFVEEKWQKHKQNFQ